jgi:frataxin
VADATLHELFEKVAVLEDIINADTSLSQGILTIDLTSMKKGIWVLNKQTPNRQIWWSSPISGPRRYEHEENITGLGECWKSSKSNSLLLSDLKSEMFAATGVNI